MTGMFPPGTFTPQSGPGSPGRMLAAQAGTATISANPPCRLMPIMPVGPT